MAKKVFGFDLLRQQVLHSVGATFDTYEDWVLGDSEIEKLFHVALQYRIELGRTEFDRVYSVSERVPRSIMLTLNSVKGSIILESQAVVEGYRVDFLISAWTEGRVWRPGGGTTEGDARWRNLVVECDGHDFHERTKEQAAKDRSRDRTLSQMGYDVFRFTGSELWKDPWDCADQVYEWAAAGFC